MKVLPSSFIMLVATTGLLSLLYLQACFMVYGINLLVLLDVTISGCMLVVTLSRYHTGGLLPDDEPRQSVQDI